MYSKPRDLLYPEDARRVRDALIDGLEYDAAFAILGERLSRLSPDCVLPTTMVVTRFGALDVENTVRKELAGLCARLAVISMISRFDRASQALLLQRRFLEGLLRIGFQKMPGPELLKIRRKTQGEIRSHSPVQVVVGLLVTGPSPALRARAMWLADIYRVRNCLAHREGIVQMEDAGDADELRVKWLKMKAIINRTELTSIPRKVDAPITLEMRFDESWRTWRIGQPVHLSAADCQDIAFSLAVLESRVLAEFEVEMNSLLRDHRPPQ